MTLSLAAAPVIEPSPENTSWYAVAVQASSFKSTLIIVEVVDVRTSSTYML